MAPPRMLALASVALGLALSVASGCTDRDLADMDTDAPADDGGPLPEDYDPGVRPREPGSMYSACADSSVCSPLEFCVFPSGEAGFCSDACDGPDDANNCDVAPDGEARAICFDIGLPDARRVCAIDCEAGRPCPDGMRCEAVDSAGQAKHVCF